MKIPMFIRPYLVFELKHKQVGYCLRSANKYLGTIKFIGASK